MRLRLTCVFAAILPLSLVPAAFAQALGPRAQSSDGSPEPAVLHHPMGLGVARQLWGLRVAGVDRRG